MHFTFETTRTINHLGFDQIKALSRRDLFSIGSKALGKSTLMGLGYGVAWSALSGASLGASIPLFITYKLANTVLKVTSSALYKERFVTLHRSQEIHCYGKTLLTGIFLSAGVATDVFGVVGGTCCAMLLKYRWEEACAKTKEEELQPLIAMEQREGIAGNGEMAQEELRPRVGFPRLRLEQVEFDDEGDAGDDEGFVRSPSSGVSSPATSIDSSDSDDDLEENVLLQVEGQ